MSLETLFSKYNPDDISIAILEKKTNKSEFKSILEHNLDKYFHPASLLKLFIAVMATQKTNQESLNFNDLHKAIYESISASDNDALAFLIDYLAPYPWDYNPVPAESEIFKKILESRLEINKFFLDQNFSEKINLVNKCFGFDYYGKERQIYEALGHNQINNHDLIKILILIEKGFPEILKAMQRDLITNTAADNNIPSNIIDTEDYQSKAFSAPVLQENLKPREIYSKAGWNSKVRHDAVIFKLPNGSSTDEAKSQETQSSTYILSILTKGLSQDEGILQEIVREVISSYNLTSQIE